MGVGLGLWLISEVAGEASWSVVPPPVVLALCSAFMLAVGAVACLVPTVRGMRIRPVEALEEG